MFQLPNKIIRFRIGCRWSVSFHWPPTSWKRNNKHLGRWEICWDKCFREWFHDGSILFFIFFFLLLPWMASHMILIGSVDKKKWYLFIYIYLFLKSLLFLRLPLLPLLFNEIHAPHVARSRPRTRSPLSFSRVSFSPQFLRVHVSSSTFYFVKFSIKRKQQQQKKRRTEPASIAANGAVNWNAARPIKKETEPHLTHFSSSRWNPATNSFAILSLKK